METTNHPTATAKVMYDLLPKMRGSHAEDHIKRAMYANASIHTMIYSLHAVMNQPRPSRFTKLQPQDLVRRLRLIYEEFLETIEAADAMIYNAGNDPESVRKDNTKIGFNDESNWQPNWIEVIDGLGDLITVCVGTLVEMGVSSQAVLTEITASNFTKLDDDGEPVINECINAASTHECPSDSCVLRDESAPVGKFLKSRNYMKPQLARMLGITDSELQNG